MFYLRIIRLLILILLGIVLSFGTAFGASRLFKGFMDTPWFEHKSKITGLDQDDTARTMSRLFIPDIYIRTDDPDIFLGITVNEIYYYFDVRGNDELEAGAGELGLVEIRFPRESFQSMVQALAEEFGENYQKTIYHALWEFPEFRVEVRKYGGSGFYYDEAPDMSTSVGVVYLEPGKEGVEPSGKPLLNEK